MRAGPGRPRGSEKQTRHYTAIRRVVERPSEVGRVNIDVLGQHDMNALIPLFTAIVAGAIGLIGGVEIPILLDQTTVQGPLLGILGTGPLGFALGGHAGVVWAARRRRRVSTIDFVWLGVFGGVILLMNELFVAGLSAQIVLLPATFLITAITAVVLVRCASASPAQRRVLVASSIVTALLFFTTTFPPVTHNPLFRRADGPSPPRFAFLGDRNMDTRHAVPPWRVDRPVLHLEWLAVATLAVFTARRYRRNGAASA